MGNYSIGRRWHVPGVRKDGRERAPFDFVIVGATESKTAKQCRIALDPLWYLDRYALSQVKHQQQRDGDGLCQDYTHRHLKKYGVLVEPDALSPVQQAYASIVSADYRVQLFALPEAQGKEALDVIYAEAQSEVVRSASTPLLEAPYCLIKRAFLRRLT